MSEVPQRRLSPRLARAFMVRYRSLEGGAVRWLVSPLRDFSRGGARFLSEQPLEVGTALELQLLLPVAREPVIVRASVAWAKPAKLGMTELGVTFDVGDAAIERTIGSAVELLKTSEGKA